MFRPVFVFLFLFLLAFGASAQTGTIIGRVMDAYTGEGLPNANVFIDQTTFGVAADVDGNFEFVNIPVGNARLVFSYVGYKQQQLVVAVEEGKKPNVQVRLVPQQEELATVEVKATKDKRWENDLRKFMKAFLGEDRIGSQCRILNSYVLDFSIDKETGDFRATASKPLEILNPALGYKVMFYLTDFRFSSSAYRITGSTQFSELAESDPKKVIQLMKNRQESYEMSSRYFLKTVLDRKTKENGFQIFTERTTGTTQRQAVFNANLGTILNPWFPGEPEIVRPGIYRLRLPARMEIHNTTILSDRRTYTDIPHAVSWMNVSGGTLLINGEGVTLNPLAITTEGEMNNNRVGRMLPLNYEPGEVVRVAAAVPVLNSERLREKAFVVTDRPYYYPGESVRFKAHVNYGSLTARDSLSIVLHVDLLGPNKELILAEKAPIDSGIAIGVLHVPDTLLNGTYYLRAWTNWMRNYGTGAFFVKPVFIVDKSERPLPGDVLEAPSPGLIVRPIIASRDSVGVAVILRDSLQETIPAHLSISVTDLSRTPAVPDASDILLDYPIRQGETKAHPEFNFPPERYLSLSGKTVALNDKPLQALVTFMLGDFTDVRTVQSAADGTFRIDSLLFFDEARIGTNVTGKKGKNVGYVVWDREFSPISDFPFIPFKLRREKTNSPSFQGDPSARMLNEVTVKDVRQDDQTRAIYGKPDHVLTADQLNLSKNGLTLLNALQNKIPGMSITTSFDQNGRRNRIILRGSGSLYGYKEPVVYINGVLSNAVDNSAASALDNINPLDVERVEIISRAIPLLGNLGYGGLIAVYTRTTVNGREPFEGAFRFTQMKGLQTWSADRAGQGSATVYWNPEVRIMPFSAGIRVPFKVPHPGKYRVLVQGVTAANKPVRNAVIIDVP
ncbi:MAG: carboxypeptidase-like regulatory domain-containing protein [Bacteroidota bacterium]